jgi:hypothetical protein
MLNRSKIVIDVDSFIHAQAFRNQTVQQNRVPYRKCVDKRVNYQQHMSSTRRAAPGRFRIVTLGRDINRVRVRLPV